MNKQEWFAIRTINERKAIKHLTPLTSEIYFPEETITRCDGTKRRQAVIKHVLFVKTTKTNLLNLEQSGKKDSTVNVPFWIFRFPNSQEIVSISETNIDLIKLLTAEDSTRCRIYNGRKFQPDEHVRIIGGPFKGYEGYVKRIGKNRHVLISIEGISIVILPFIHPDLLEHTTA